MNITNDNEHDDNSSNHAKVNAPAARGGCPPPLPAGRESSLAEQNHWRAREGGERERERERE